MDKLIKRLLREAIQNLPDSTINQELKYLKNKSVSTTKKADLNLIRFKITKASDIANQYANQTGDYQYFNLPDSGEGFYQVEIKYDGSIRTKHIKASPNMNQLGQAFHPTDVGTCKDFQNIARYCFVKAGKPINDKFSFGASPAEDAANKTLIIFKDEILAFLSDSKLDTEKANQISKDKMTPELSKHKVKKDLETELGFKLTDSQWNNYLETGQKPKPKPTLSANQDELDDFEARQKAAMERREKALARMNLK
jgi:hypothetical protein